MFVRDTTNSWTYTTATFRQAGGNTASQLDFIVGVDEVPLSAQVVTGVKSSGAGTVYVVGIGIDSTSAVHANTLGGAAKQIVANIDQVLSAYIQVYPGIGRHTAVWLEYSAASGTTTWLGDDATTYLRSGISGVILG